MAGGIKDNLIDMYNGIAFKPDDPLEMARAIDTLLDDKSLYSRLACNALEYARTQSWEQIFTRFFARLQEILSENTLVA